MKKFISILLAILMIFSVTTVAFAADDEPTEEPTTVAEEETTEENFEVTELPVWTVKVGLKVGKIVVKIAAALLKVADKLGLIDLQEILTNLIESIQSGDVDFGGIIGGETTTEAPAETTLATA